MFYTLSKRRSPFMPDIRLWWQPESGSLAGVPESPAIEQFRCNSKLTLGPKSQKSTRIFSCGTKAGGDGSDRG